ncbi:MAG: 2-oxo acid dehydrogenase subunit E2 [Anaerolineales bacterium]|nr:2-oxo acid dehydrogenase subunit E2 [Anaerolineales bacterium]
MNSENMIGSQNRTDINNQDQPLTKKPTYRAIPFTMNRRFVAASASAGRQQNTIHTFIEVDISQPKHIIHKHCQQTGEKLSLTAYVVACLARAIADFPYMNSFRKGNKLILLENVTISVQAEQELGRESVPDPIGIQAAQTKSYRQIYKEIREAQEKGEDMLGGQTGMAWVRFIPGFLLRLFFNLASKNIQMMERYGVISVTAIGMFEKKNQAI